MTRCNAKQAQLVAQIPGIRSVRGLSTRTHKKNMNQTIRIIVADDHSSVRLGVSKLLESIPHMLVVGVASDTLALAELLDTCPCDLIVSDIGMPGIDGESNAILFLRRTLRFMPQVPIVILTMIHQTRTLAGLLHMGAAGIVDKRDAAASLVTAIEAAHAGRRYLSRHVREALGDAAPGLLAEVYDWLAINSIAVAGSPLIRYLIVDYNTGEVEVDVGAPAA